MDVTQAAGIDVAAAGARPMKRCVAERISGATNASPADTVVGVHVCAGATRGAPGRVIVLAWAVEG